MDKILATTTAITGTILIGGGLLRMASFGTTLNWAQDLISITSIGLGISIIIYVMRTFPLIDSIETNYEDILDQEEVFENIEE